MCVRERVRPHVPLRWVEVCTDTVARARIYRHAWLHKMTDDLPTDPQHDWQPSTAEYKENQSGTKVSKKWEPVSCSSTLRL